MNPTASPQPSNPLDFKNLFRPVPAPRISCGFLELGAWSGSAYEAEFQVALWLGPDGKIWAEVGDLEDLPLLPLRERETLAARMVDEFLEACHAGLLITTDDDLAPENPSLATLQTWPVPRVMHWLQQPTTLARADPAQRRLIHGLLEELRGLGFHPKP